MDEVYCGKGGMFFSIENCKPTGNLSKFAETSDILLQKRVF